MMAQLEGAPVEHENTQTEVDIDRAGKKISRAAIKNLAKNRDDGGATQVCASTIMKMDIKKSMFLVGDVFMRKYYTIFDRDNDRVGLALANTPERAQSL